MIQIGDIVTLIAEPKELETMGISANFHHITGEEFEVVTLQEKFKSMGIRHESISKFKFMVLSKFLIKKYK